MVTTTREPVLVSGGGIGGSAGLGTVGGFGSLAFGGTSLGELSESRPEPIEGFFGIGALMGLSPSSAK